MICKLCDHEFSLTLSDYGSLNEYNTFQENCPKCLVSYYYIDDNFNVRTWCFSIDEYSVNIDVTNKRTTIFKYPRKHISILSIDQIVDFKIDTALNKIKTLLTFK
jgi:hypothetical protein